MTEAKPTLSELVSEFARIGCLSFGGPAGQIALMHRRIVDERRWVGEDDYLAALNFCHLLPGPEAQQLATWIGWRLHGTLGGVISGLLFVLPGVAVMLGLSLLYVAAVGLTWFDAVFLGVKAAVLAIVAQALLRIAGRALKTGFHRALALAAFVAMALFAVDFPWVIGAAALAGLIAARWRPGWIGAGHGAAQRSTTSGATIAGTLRTIIIWAAIWGAPLALVGVTLGLDHILWDIGAFFAKLAIVTFGGAYAVLAYMAQEAAGSLGWVTPAQMADGLGLAETTPGPLILVTQHIGFLAAWANSAPFSPWVAAVLAALLVSWVTFAPCFLWIFALAPWIDRLRSIAALQAALSALTAAVVGAIASLSLWFAIHLLFTREAQLWGLVLPGPASLDVAALGLALFAALLLFRTKAGVFGTLMAAAGAGLLTGLL
ncbi:MAG: chromate efflux transporter [Sphingopyxis sp.]|nr:chromate efflux transporter [Sphingopyxis sp.]